MKPSQSESNASQP